MRKHANAKARKLENARNAKTQKTRKRRKRENAESAKTQKTRKRRKRENAKTRNTQSKQRNAKNDQTSHGRRTEMQNTNKRKHENAKTRKRFSRFSRFLGFLVFSVFSFSRFSRFLVFSFRWPHPCGHVAFFMCLAKFKAVCVSKSNFKHSNLNIESGYKRASPDDRVVWRGNLKN